MNKEIIKRKKPINTKIFYGWVIVIIGAIGAFFSGPGQTYSVSIFINHYVEDFGWSRSMVSSYYSIATLIAGFALPIVGRAIDKKGHRKLISFISVLLGLVCLWMSFVRTPAMLAFGFIFLRLFGQGSMSLMPETLIPLWFVDRRAKAISLMAIGKVISSALLPPLNTWLISNLSVGFTWLVWAVLLIAFMAPLGWILVVDKPEDIGEEVDGGLDLDYQRPDIKYKAKVDLCEYSWTVKEATKTKAFWFMLFCIMIPAMVHTGVTFHMVSIIEQKGYSSIFAAFVLSLMAMVQLPVTFFAGFILDKVKVHHAKAVSFAVYLLAMFILLYSQSEAMLIFYGLIQGAFLAFDAVSNGVLWPNYFGIEHLGSIRSFTMVAIVIGSSLGPLPFGFAYDLLGGYQEILLIMMIFIALAIFASFFAPAPKPPENTCI